MSVEKSRGKAEGRLDTRDQHMLAAVIHAVNVDPVCCTETTSKINIFKPSHVIYRTAVAGAMLRVVLLSKGENFYTFFNRWVSCRNAREEITKEYISLLRELPKVSVTDGILLRESSILPENYNLILDGTATALGSIKKASLGKLAGYQIVGVPHLTFRAVPNLLKHYFRAPGADWRFIIFGQEGELAEGAKILQIALREVGLGGKHSFRGRFIIKSIKEVELKPIMEPVMGELCQPLICRDGRVEQTLKRLRLTPVRFRATTRYSGIAPCSRIVPALEGVFKAETGYQMEFEGKTLIVTGEDLNWPHHLEASA